MRILNILLAAIICMPSFAQTIKPVKWSYTSNRINKTEAVLAIKATIDEDWHIYSTNQKPGGPVKTTFTFAQSPDYLPVGKLTEPKPSSKYEEVFDIRVDSFEKEVVFRQKIKLLAKQTIVVGKLEYMACTEGRCLNPVTIEFTIPVN